MSWSIFSFGVFGLDFLVKKKNQIFLYFILSDAMCLVAKPRRRARMRRLEVIQMNKWYNGFLKVIFLMKVLKNIIEEYYLAKK